MANDNPFELLSKNQGVPAAPISAPGQPVAGAGALSSSPDPAANPFTALSQQSLSPSATTAQGAPSAAVDSPNPPSTNPFTTLSQSNALASSPLRTLTPEEQAQSSRQDPENNEDEPWYSKTWNWLNKPLWDLHQYGTRTGAGSFERGVESGAEDLVSGLTSPLSIALTVGTLGGDTALNVGVAGLKAAGISAEAAPFVAHGAKALLDLGFTGQAVKGLITQSPEFLDALKDGDTESAARIGTNILAAGTMTAFGAGKTFEDAGFVKDTLSGKTRSQIETLKTVKDISGRLDQGNHLAGEGAAELEAELHKQMAAAGITDPIVMGGVRRYIEAQGNVDLLKDQHDATAGALQVRPMDAINTPVPNPSIKDFGQKKNFDEFVAKNYGGDEQAARDAMAKIVDAIRYTDDKGVKHVENVKPADQIPVGQVWDKDHVYHASDSRNDQQIRNTGIGASHEIGPNGKGVQYYSTPEEALADAALPPSGDKKDLSVFAVPLKKVQDGITDESEEMASEGLTKARHMPSHQIVIDEDGKPTGKVIPLSSDSKFDLTRDNERFNKTHSPKEREQVLAEYQAGMKLTQPQKDFADRMTKFYADGFGRANEEGIIRQAVEGYHPRAWIKDRPGFFQNLFGKQVEPSDNEALNALRHQTDNGAFDTSVNAAKHRVYDTSFQAEMAGEKNKTNDIAYHAANWQHHLDKAIAARTYLEDLRASGATASDGRPLVALTPSSKILGAESENPALLVNGAARRGVRISPKIIQDMMGKGQLEDLVNSGKIEKLPFDKDINNPATGEKDKLPGYAWSTDGYQTIDHPSMRDWAYAGKDTAGNNAIVKTEMRVHPEAADYIRQVIGADPSVFRTNAYLRTLMAAQREVKGSLLAFSPFHAIQEGLRGLMLGINPLKDNSGNWLKWSPVHSANDPVLLRGVRNGLTFPDYHAEDMFSEGVGTHSKTVGSIPVLGKMQNYLQDFTFKQLIPNLKARAYKSVVERFRDRMEGASEDEIAHSAASYVNDTFGGQNWRELGISATGQDFMRSVMLAPDWLTSEARSLYRVAGGMGKPAQAIAAQDMARIAGGVFITARVINMLTSGKPHPEAPFGLVIPGKDGQDDKVYSMRTLPTDLMHVLTDPRGFIEGRVNPLTVRTGLEAVYGRNDRGQKVTGEQEVTDALRNFVPIGAQGLLQGKIPGGATTADQLVKAAGATVYSYKTAAEKIAQEKASDHMPSGAVDPSELATHQRNLRIEDGLRDGSVSRGDVMRLMDARQAKELISQSTMTPLQARVTRLPLKDAIDVWNVSTPSEKDALSKILWDKRRSYISTHTGSQRENDPTWQKLQAIHGDLQSPTPIPETPAAPAPVAETPRTATPVSMETWKTAVATAEGFYDENSIPARAHNPGDLKNGDIGYGTFPGGITKYPTDEAGLMALEHQLTGMHNGTSHNYTGDMTLLDVAKKYTGNDHPEDWAKTVADHIGVSPDTKLGDLKLISANNTMTFHEDPKAGDDMNDPDTRFAAARHEAGHAVLAEEQNPGVVQHMELGDFGGRTTVSAPDNKPTMGDLNHDELRNMVATSMAGGLSQYGGTTPEASSGDMVNREKLLGAKAGTLDDKISIMLTGHTRGTDPMLQANQTLAEGHARANAMLADPAIQERINSLATLLAQRGKLTGEEVRDHLKQHTAEAKSEKKPKA